MSAKNSRALNMPHQALHCLLAVVFSQTYDQALRIYYIFLAIYYIILPNDLLTNDHERTVQQSHYCAVISQCLAPDRV